LAKKNNNILGAWLFIIGIVIALGIGILTATKTATEISTILASILVILGFIVGFTNVMSKDINRFLISVAVLAIISFAGGASGLGNIKYIGIYVLSMFAALFTFIIPAAITVALKEVWNVAYRKP